MKSPHIFRPLPGVKKQIECRTNFVFKIDGVCRVSYFQNWLSSWVCHGIHTAFSEVMLDFCICFSLWNSISLSARHQVGTCDRDIIMISFRSAHNLILLFFTDIHLCEVILSNFLGEIVSLKVFQNFEKNILYMTS